MPAEWLLGVGLCLAGAAFTNFGLTLQKLSFTRHDALNLPPHKQRASCLQPLWLVGFSLFLVGQVGGMIAMGFSSQSVVATLGSFSLVTNAIFAPLILGEQLTWMLVLSILVIMAGSVIVVLSSNHDNQDYTLQQLLDLFSRDLFTAYASILAFCLLLCVMQMVREHRRHAREQMQAVPSDDVHIISSLSDNDSINTSVSLPPSPYKPLLSPSSSFDANPSINSSPLSDTDTASPTSSAGPSPLSAFTPTLTAAILSSISVLLGKCTMQLLKTSFTTPDNQFKSPLSYVITAIFLTAAIASVHLLNTGLRRGTALFVVPFYYVSSTSLAIGGGLVYFEEFSAMGWLQCVVFFGGVGLTVLGVWISTRGQMEEEEREREEEEEEEEVEALEEEDGVVDVRVLTEEDEVDKDARLEEEEHKSSSSTPRRHPPTLPQSPASSSSASPTSRSAQPSPRATYLPNQPAIAEEDALMTSPAAAPLSARAVEEEAEEERESQKRRAWHAKRAVSEPGITFIATTPTKADLLLRGEQYGTFTSSTSPSTSSSASPSLISTTLSRNAHSSSSTSSRLGRTQSLSLSLNDPSSHPTQPLSRHQLSRANTARNTAVARSSYTPHYTLAWYPVMPSNPPAARRKRSVSVAGSRHLSPSGTPTSVRRLRM